MNNTLFNNLFNFKVRDNLKINISKNELYIQLLLYMFDKTDNNLLILTSNLNEANFLYNKLSYYLNNIYLFPDDDYISKKAMVESPELLMMRLDLLNNIGNRKKKIVISHLNSFKKLLPNPINFETKKIILKKQEKLERKDFIKKLVDLGYKLTSIVTNTGEFSVRGYIIDVFSICEEHPFRIETDFNVITNLRYFDENTQLSIGLNNEIIIKPFLDNFNDNNSNIQDYLKNPLVIIQDIDQIEAIEKRNKQLFNFYKNENENFIDFKNIKINKSIFVDTIKNNEKYDYAFKASNVEDFKNYEQLGKFINDKINIKLYVDNKDKNINFINKINDNKKIVFEKLNKGFKYNDFIYYSIHDIVNEKKVVHKNNFKYGIKINNLKNIHVGDYVVHKENGVGIYSGINTINKNGKLKDYILINYKNNDKLYVPIENINTLYKYSSKNGVKPKINKLNSLEWKKTKLSIKKRINDISKELIKIYKSRNEIKIEKFAEDDVMQEIFENEFMYNETIDQIKAINEIKSDLESQKPMDRLLCGDVGFGKTEVIFRSAFKTISNNKQVMYLCPTTLLSLQQYNSAIERFKNFPVNIALLNRFTTKKETKEILNNYKKGNIDILFGTHRLLSPDVISKNLGLLVIDEEHRFGVVHKEKIKSFKNQVHVLSVSATPIPRSLQMSLVGIRDLSLIESAPNNRLPVQTYVLNYDKILLREAILREKDRKGQIFILYNKVSTIEKYTKELESFIPNVRFDFAHGRMNKEMIEDKINNFVNKDYDCLVTTTIIENGIDIPNANTIIVIDSDKFGLSQLYQIRGRVGRGERIAFAYLMYKKEKVLTETAKKRLEAIKEFTELGSGFKISMRDLSIRGAGDILGSEQAGFIDSVGVEMYLELINEELNGKNDEKVENRVNLDDVNSYIDRNYISDDNIIIEIHNKINNINNKGDFIKLQNEIVDRFGKNNIDIKIYMMQEYAENLINLLKIDVYLNDNNNISFKLNEEIFKKLEIDNLFNNVLKISTKFNFKYKNNSIIINLKKKNLEDHYLKYVIEMLDYINLNIKK